MNICCKSPPTWIIWSQVLNSNLNHICQILLWHHSEAAAQPLRHHCSSPGMHSCKKNTKEIHRIYIWYVWDVQNISVKYCTQQGCSSKSKEQGLSSSPFQERKLSCPRAETGAGLSLLSLAHSSGIRNFQLRKLQATPDLQILNLNRPLKSSWTQW